jgi:molybdopterin-guanine dinucleotide biosynthesis protein A
MNTDLPRHRVTGLVLAGGRGSRMGGLDKGLRMLGTQALAELALERLRPQVDALAINANRHLEVYARFGVPVWPDADGDFHGPLAGMLAGLSACDTEWLVTVPCDTPHFPTDLVTRLYAAARHAGVRVALPVTHNQPQPVFCLLHRSLRAPLAAALAAGERKAERFTHAQGQVLVPFADTAAFFNANTPEDLDRLRATTRAGPAPSA